MRVLSRIGERLLERVVPGERAGACYETYRCINGRWYYCANCAGHTSCVPQNGRCIV